MYLLNGALTLTKNLHSRIVEYKTNNYVMMKYRWMKKEVIDSAKYNVWKQEYVEITNKVKAQSAQHVRIASDLGAKWK